MSTLSDPSEWDETVLASMTRDQLILFSKLHDAHGDMRRKNERLKRLASGAGMALAGVYVDPEFSADLATARDLIQQMVED